MRQTQCTTFIGCCQGNASPKHTHQEKLERPYSAAACLLPPDVGTCPSTMLQLFSDAPEHCSLKCGVWARLDVPLFDNSGYL